MNASLPDPAQDDAAWARLRHRQKVARRRRWTNARRLSWFVVPVLVVVAWAVLFLPQFSAAPHSATVCYRFACQHFSSGEYADYLGWVTGLYFLLAAFLAVFLMALFFGKHPPFPVRFTE